MMSAKNDMIGNNESSSMSDAEFALMLQMHEFSFDKTDNQETTPQQDNTTANNNHDEDRKPPANQKTNYFGGHDGDDDDDDDDDDRKLPAKQKANYFGGYDDDDDDDDDDLFSFDENNVSALTGNYEYNKMMMSTSVGRAYAFVEKLIQVFDYTVMLATSTAATKSSSSEHAFLSSFSLVANDDLVYLAEQMFDAQYRFRLEKKPCKVDIGYHYTDETKMEFIRTTGLMSKEEQILKNFVSQTQRSGGTFGDGIYTGNNASAFKKYGTIGLIVARLKGIVKDVGNCYKNVQQSNDVYDTIVGNKKRRGTSSTSAGSHLQRINKVENYDEVVLLNSYQCLPLVCYYRSLMNNPNENHCLAILQMFQESLQNVINEFFNNELLVYDEDEEGGDMGNEGSKKPFHHQPPPSQKQQEMQHEYDKDCTTPPNNANIPSFFPLTKGETIHYKQPRGISTNSMTEYEFQKYCIEINHPRSDLSCPICLERSNTDIFVKLNRCGHMLHKLCLQQNIAYGNVCCCICQVPLVAPADCMPYGKSPSGKMTINIVPSVSCEGYDYCGTIEIIYDMPRGVQMLQHANPGLLHGSLVQKAYLPDCFEGRNLLERLKIAFLKGHTFTIGTNQITGDENCILWASIPHKTNRMIGGIYGFPDEEYFQQCHDALDRLNIPRLD